MDPRDKFPEGEPSLTEGTETQDLTQEQVSDSDTKPETDDSSSDTNAAETLNPYEKALIEAGLNRQFRDVNDLISRAPEMNQYIHKLEEQRKEDNDRLRILLEKIAEPTREYAPPQTDEELIEEINTRPREALDKLGYVRKNDIQTLRQQYDDDIAEIKQQVVANTLADQFSQYDDLKSLAPVVRGRGPIRPGMNKMYDTIMYLMNTEFPEFSAIPADKALKHLVPLAKQRLGTSEKPPVQPVSEVKKEQAHTTGSKKPSGSKLPTNEQLSTMSLSQLKKYVADNGLINYD